MKGINHTAEAGEALRDLGYRLTPQRQLILTAIQESDDHISAEEIHAQVCTKYPHVNISTGSSNRDRPGERSISLPFCRQGSPSPPDLREVWDYDGGR